MTIHPDTHVDGLVERSREALFEVETLQNKSRGVYRNGIKRALDIVLVALCSLPIALVVFTLAFGVALKGGKPFYVQQRVGRGGRTYRMWKLRTMVPNADDVLQRHLDEDDAARAEWSVSQKLKNDPRITRFGRILRRTSLDELPQLWNVLKGDMSLVGPRPMMPQQQVLYPGHAYFRMRPGITGPWQVSDRNETAFADRARFDTHYERDMSLRHDIGLIAATFRVVLRATGY